MSSDSPITQVSNPEDSYSNELAYQQQEDGDELGSHDTIPQKLTLDLRGTRIEIDRDTLINLPENLLVAMFPSGLVLPRPSSDSEHEGDDDFHHSMNVEGQVNVVDFDPTCLNYVLEFFSYAAQVRDENQKKADIQQLLANAATSPVYFTLLTKQPIIVLREELEYFCVPTRKGQAVQLKREAGQYLQQQNRVFDALQKNISRENNVAEQHLIDMLCDAGFNRDDEWGYRATEPSRTVITSMSLALLKTIGPNNHMATAQKLFLFWRKPARKCWWDGNSVEIQDESIRLWARRTWTLELALV